MEYLTIKLSIVSVPYDDLLSCPLFPLETKFDINFETFDAFKYTDIVCVLLLEKYWNKKQKHDIKNPTLAFSALAFLCFIVIQKSNKWNDSGNL